MNSPRDDRLRSTLHPRRIESISLRGSLRVLDRAAAYVLFLVATASLVFGVGVMQKVGTALLAATIGALAFRASMSGVRMTEDGLDVVSTLRTVRIPWPMITHIGLATLGRTRSVMFVATTDGKRVRVNAVAGTRWGNQDNLRVQAAVADLQARVAARASNNE